MIEQILDHIHNYFVREKYTGNFVVSNGAIEVDFLQDCQYFKIVGSVFNDGVHQYGIDGLIDEAFEGEVWSMAVPPSFISLVDEITEWVSKNRDAINSPFQSESFGGYSYTKSSYANGNGNSGDITWQGMFRNRLNAYRKLS